MFIVPEIVPPAEDEVGFSVEGGSHLAKTTVTTTTLEAVFVPEHVQRLQQVPVEQRRHVVMFM